MNSTLNTAVWGMLVTGLITLYLIGSRHLKVFHAVVAMLFGFFLAASPIASAVNRTADWIVRAISG